jgi:hypothetical protein
MNASFVFSPAIAAQLESFAQQSRKAAMMIPLFCLSIVGNGLVTAFVMAFEYEILYRIFHYLAGDDSEYWTPAIMGLSAFILVIAIHYMAETNKDNPSFAFIRKAVGRLTIVYLFGIGLLLSLLLYLTGGDIFNGEILSAYSEDGTAFNWMDGITRYITMPVTGALFSLGVGGLAIVSAFVAHSAMDKVKTALNEITVRRNNWAMDKRDLGAYRDAESVYDVIAQERQTHTPKDDDTLANEVVADALFNINEALEPSLISLNDHLMQQQAPDELPRSALNIEQLQKAVKPLQTITTQTLLSALKSTKTKD